MKNGRSWKDGKKGGGSRGWVVYFLLFVSNILKAKGGEQKKMFYIEKKSVKEFLGNEMLFVSYCCCLQTEGVVCVPFGMFLKDRFTITRNKK